MYHTISSALLVILWFFDKFLSKPLQKFFYIQKPKSLCFVLHFFIFPLMNARVYVRAFIGVKNKVHSTKEKWNFSSSTNYEILRSVSIWSKSLVKISSGDEHTEDDYYDLIPNPYRRSVYFSPIPYFTARSGGGGEWWNSFKRAPGSEFLGKRAPGSEFLGKRAPGSEFLGKRAPGSEFLGKRAPGSEFLGKRAPGSEVSLAYI